MRPYFILYFLLLVAGGNAQTFPVTGQLASTAFPVCGSNVFKQSTVPMGMTTGLTVPGCGIYDDKNPFWYSFTCYEGGTLGFTITPNNLNDDYDWMLFDYTGHPAGDVYTDPQLVVVGNWSGTEGLTGAKKGGSLINECASDPLTQHIPTFSEMPVLVQGHKYLLLISHYTESQSGYGLSFGGGTASINDPLLPALDKAAIQCDRKSILITLNKQMQCNSLAADGSDFFFSNGPYTVTGATGLGCDSGFDMTSVLLQVSQEMIPGEYSILIKNGHDGNTLLDDCGAQIDSGDHLTFTVLPPRPTSFDSLSLPGCSAEHLQILFADPIRCNSIASDGSDFSISGNSIVSISSVTTNCQKGLTNQITINLKSPIVVGGDYQIKLNQGTDGNAIINACGVQTPAGAVISFQTRDTVSAAFSYTIGYGCKFDTLALNYQPAHGVNENTWYVDSSLESHSLNPSFIETVFGLKQIQHLVSNGFCSDTVIQTINLDNYLKADFQTAETICPKDQVPFVNKSVGHVVSWIWNFGDGTFSNEESPAAHVFPNTQTEKNYLVSLAVLSNRGCVDTASAHVLKLQSCYITVPNAFTPDGDGKNDYLYPLNAFSASNLEFQVYNRYGQLVFETRDWTQKWDGTINGAKQGTGTYLWTLRYTDGLSGRKFFLKGTSVLIR